MAKPVRAIVLVLGAVFWPHAASALTVADLIDRFEGQYRATIEGAAIGRPDEGVITLHTFVHRIDAPAFGDDVIYMEQRYGGPEGTINRQRVFAFTQDGAAVMTTAYDFTDGAKYARTDAVPERLSDVRPEDLYSFPEGCRIRWTDENNTYVGAVSRQNCAIESRFGWGTVLIDMVYRLDAPAFTLYEQGYNDSDELLFGSPDAQSHARLADVDLDAELDQILATFEGTFEYLPTDANAPSFERMMRSFHTKARQVDLPAFGTRVQYLEVSENGPDGRLLRQRLNVFDDDPNRAANVMRSYAFKNGAAYLGSYKDPGKLAGLKPEDLDVFETGCELIWTERSGVSTGVVNRTTCHIFNDNLNVWRHVFFMYMLDGDSLHLWEQGFTPEGAFVFGSRGPLQYPRIQTAW